MKTKYGFYKVAAASFENVVGNVSKNASKIADLIVKAKENGDFIVVFPELSLVGYTCNDLFCYPQLAEKCLEEIKLIASKMPDDIIALIGGIIKIDSKLYNVAYVLENKKVRGISVKTYIPNYREFYEKRYFSSANELRIKEIEIDGENVPIGNDLIYSCGEIKFGVEICEDLWVISPISDKLALAGANLICNLSSSNDVLTKADYRRKLVSFQSGKDYLTYIYSSSCGGESSQDLVFKPHQIIASNGKILVDKQGELGLTEELVDIQVSDYDRFNYSSSFDNLKQDSCRTINIDIKYKDDFLPSFVETNPFVNKDKDSLYIRANEIFSLQVESLVTRLKNTSITHAVIGVSGGLDSCLAVLVTVEAFKKLSLPLENVICVSMPGLASSSLTKKNALSLMKKLGVTYKVISIVKEVKLHLSMLNHPIDSYDVVFENTQARIRTETLMNLANKYNGLVIGTGDMSEAALGFCTYNGDHMAMYNVNISIPKTLVKEIVKVLASQDKKLNKVLESIVNTPYSPELVPSTDGNISQVTENIIGKYELHDFFLYHFLRHRFDFEKIYELAKIAYPNIESKYIFKTLETFKKRFFASQFKRSCTPDGAKVGTVGLSPRGDLRLASDLKIPDFLK